MFDKRPGAVGAPAYLSGAAPPFRLTTLGKPALFAGDRTITVANRKSLALLVYLAHTTHGTESRERLAGLLWSESSESKARASLRHAVGDLRQVLADGDVNAFSADRLTASVDLPMVSVDILEIRRALASGTLASALLERKRLAETFLESFEDLDPSFRNWLMVQRQCFQDDLIRSLEDMVARERDLQSVKRLGMALLNLDPTHELGCRVAMEASARMGDTAGALKLYEALWTVLDEEFDSEPSDKTLHMISEIKLGRIAPVQAAEHRAGPMVSLIAQPTRSGMSVRPPERPALSEQALYLFVGAFEASGAGTPSTTALKVFRHEILASLVRFRDWAVLDLDRPMPTAVNRPAYLIEGLAFDDGELLRVILTLKDVATGRFLWSEQFAIGNAEWYQTQQQMVRRIAIALDVSMSSERLTQICNVPDLSLDQFDKWLKGQELVFRWKPEDEARAETLFRSIIDEAPRFAPAYAGIAGIINSRHLIFPGVYRTADRHAEALRFAKTAAQIDPIDSRIQLHLAWSYAMNGMADKAGLTFLLACELNANDPWTLVSASLGLAYCNDLENAERLSRLAVDIGLGVSRLHWGYQAGVRFMLGNYAGCVEAAEQADNAVSYIGGWKAAAHALAGDHLVAKQEAERFIGFIRSNWVASRPPSDEEILRWLLHCFPIASPDVQDRLQRGLFLAGLPVETAKPRRAAAAKASLPATADRIVGDA